MPSPKAPHILCIRFSAMGDVAMTVPVLLALTRQYPELKITVLSKPFFAPFFKGIQNVTFYGADVKQEYKGVCGLFKLYKTLKPKQFTAVADLHNVLRSNVLLSFFRLRGTKNAQTDKGRAEKKALTQQTNKVFKPLKSTHQRYADVFKELGFPVDLKGDEVLPKQKLSNAVYQALGNEPFKWLGIAPFAAHDGKKYPLELLDVLLADLASKKYKIILFGGGTKEQQLLNAFEAKYKNVVNVAGKFSFTEELALISHLDAMLAMDSGNGHMAALFGVPTVTLWGVTHPYLGFAPYMQPEKNQLKADREEYPAIPTSAYGNKVPEGYDKVMHSIKPKTILNRLIQILD
ncbi:ADP-heptose:LPS heptosyltransferase [Leeuwenhoekiella aestuarii]|uniref:ADP-heptose:LPS heptosyltransferase n=1 Tax=Leeuwenhoekiella aestuarii TaxID=2249426 RepID=A0A4Q0NYY4_9FLAO|nr:glycosyltransferase family 9 protein [Leeuwenhoekiella aestuarii]RXG17911.1 ADP-heptose:LPS heptosyltransferase [Leeuwenhoekiella aestuarii]RXG19240.1 ADP-heptose:LPS heptosyltransferase [Leeuwenhoekiella aestuarii]